MYIYNEEELSKNIDLLNALLNPYREWRYTTAKKDHEDLFGVTIKEGEGYFKRDYGQAWDDVIKMSRESMDKFIHCLFNGDFHIQRLAEALQKNRIEEMQKEINKLSY